MNLLDIGLILIFIMFIIVGIKRGVIKEAVSLVALIIVFVLSFSLKGIIGNILCVLLPFLNLDGFVMLNIFFYQLVAFILLFCVLMSLYEASLRISKFLQKVVNATIILWLPSKILGGVVSLLKGYIVVFIVLIFLIIPFGKFSFFQDSKIAQYMLYQTPVLSGYASNFTTPVKESIDLMVRASNGSIAVNEANLEALDLMLKYKVVDKSTIESLIEVHKLDDVEGMETILNQY